MAFVEGQKINVLDRRPTLKMESANQRITINRLQNTENAEASDNELTISAGPGAASGCAKDAKNTCRARRRAMFLHFA